jgi:hypothetical protein
MANLDEMTPTHWVKVNPLNYPIVAGDNFGIQGKGVVRPVVRITNLLHKPFGGFPKVKSDWKLTVKWSSNVDLHSLSPPFL